MFASGYSENSFRARCSSNLPKSSILWLSKGSPAALANATLDLSAFAGRVERSAPTILSSRAKAYSIPKEEPGRDELLENALKVASDAPFEIVETMNEVSLIIEELAVKGSRLAISDVGVAAAACRAAVCGASMNVYINTKLMKDREYAASVNEKTDAIVKTVCDRCDKAYNDVLGGLKA